MVYSAKSDDTDTISQFTRLKYIYVTTNGSSTPANYQVKLIIDYEPEMQADFSDIRFNTLGNIYIDYWIESKTDSVTATVWVKLPDAITDPGSDTIWMYYGNAGLSDGGNGNDTFLFFDDFSGDLSKWDTTGTPSISAGIVSLNDDDVIVSKTKFGYGYCFEGYSKADEQDTGLIAAMETDANQDNCLQIFNTDANPDDFDKFRMAMVEGGSWTQNDNDNWDDFRTTFLNYRIKRPAADDVTFEQVAHTVQYTSGNIPTVNLGLAFRVWDSSQESTLQVEWGFVRKYIADKPTILYGTSQHQRRVPQFIN